VCIVRKVVEIAGLRTAGLGGVFRGKVAPATFENPKQYLSRCGKGNFWRGGLPLTHRSTIFPIEYQRLQKQRADILVTLEGSSSHAHDLPPLTN